MLETKKSQLQRTVRITFGMALSVAVLTGCSVGPDFVRPENLLRDVELHPRTDYDRSYSVKESTMPARWWSLFDDELLNQLQSKALADNLDVQVAISRIEQSRAQLGITTSELLPSISTGANYSREALSKHGKFAALGAPSKPHEFSQIGFDANWELDLWGRARRAREGAIATLEATEYDSEAVRVTLAAEVARAYLQLRGTQAQLDIARQNKNIAENALNLAESRERNGIATRFETSSARAALATINAMLPELHQHRNSLMNALALLVGAPPRALDELLQRPMPLPSLPAEVPVGVPSELAHRRPDILRAEAQLHAATASIGVAKSDFYPRIGLGSRFGVEAFKSQDLNSWDSRFFSVGPTVYLPVFQGGKLVQRLALNEAQQKAAALTYRQTVLRAWHEVDNAIDAWAAQSQQHAELSIAFEENKLALQVAERGYQEGAADYLSVLTAQRNLLSSQTSLNTSATNATLMLVNLYKALGGGWNHSKMALPEDTPVHPQKSEASRLLISSASPDPSALEVTK